MTLVFVSGPYSDSPQARVLDAAEAVRALMAKGYAVYCPHLHWHYFDLIHPHGYEDYMTQCLEMLGRCDVVLRLPGDSPGSDREVMAAAGMGITVVHGLDGLADWESAS